MTLIALASIKGSPGVTTAATALAASWPESRQVLLVEADPFGGDLAPRYAMAPSGGLSSLFAAARRTLAPEDVWDHVDHHIRIEGTERIGDDRPSLLIGDGLVHASQTEQDRETPGKVVDVVPDVLGGKGAPRCGEKGGEASGGRHGVAGSEVTAEGIGLDQEDLAALRPAGGQGGGRRGDAR